VRASVWFTLNRSPSGKSFTANFIFVLSSYMYVHIQEDKMWGIRMVYTPDRSRQEKILAAIKNRQRKQAEEKEKKNVKQ